LRNVVRKRMGRVRDAIFAGERRGGRFFEDVKDS
jgi:hypothetical protein